MHRPYDDLGIAVRILWIGAMAVAGTVVVSLALLLPDLDRFLPDAIRTRRVGSTLIVLAAAYVIGRVWASLSRRRGREGGPVIRLVRRADAVAGVALSGGLSIAFAAACFAYLATWLPHYLLWPWARDSDTFATLAQAWDAGIRPYRDIRGYNFPGAIYLFLLLGKTFGWGRTWALYAVDAAGLVLLGVILAEWSRRCLGRIFPGLASYFLFLTFYLNLNFELVAQRDWHTSLCIVLGVLLLEAWPGRASRIASAALCAAALSIRPHAVLFLPALASAVREGDEPTDERRPTDRRLRWRRLAAWSLMLAMFTALAFSPLMLAGIADDLVRGLRIAAYGGPYSQANLATVAEVLVDQWHQVEAPGALLLVVLATTRGAERRRAVTWSLALGAAFIYRLLHPVQHRYLGYPLALVDSIALALSIGWIIDRAAIPPLLRVVGALLVIGEMSLGLPLFCNVPATVEAIVCIAHNRGLPLEAPPGTGTWFDPRKGRWYRWQDYRKTLIYLRATTAPGTLVANVLKEPPYPPINGPTGRPSPFRAESGICWMLLVNVDLDAEFAAALERATDSVVIWSPEEQERVTRLRLDRLDAVIREHYRPEVRFGRIEIWRRADAAR